jgi:hypothetical protein
MRYFLLTISIILTVFFPIQSVNSSQTEISDVAVSYSYGESITFEANIQSDQPIEEVLIFLQPEDETTRLGKADQNAAGKYVFQFDTRQDPMEPFIEIQYWYRISFRNGDDYESEKYTFQYNDNRFDWQNLKDGRFDVYWYGAGADYGQDILNVANLAFESVQGLLPSDFYSAISIYVYAASADLQSALQFSQRSWIAGHSNPQQNIILISVPLGPSQRLELERQIPHELMHLSEYHLAGSSYSKIPIWLLEGIASMAEIYPNPDYQRILDLASRERSLIPINTLCSTFPRDASSAFMAYAQSESFTNYILDNYGSSGLNELISQYADGRGCEEGPEAAFGVTLSQLEFRWEQETLGVGAGVFILQNLFPYIFILAIILLVPFFTILPGLLNRK